MRQPGCRIHTAAVAPRPQSAHGPASSLWDVLPKTPSAPQQALCTELLATGCVGAALEALCEPAAASTAALVPKPPPHICDADVIETVVGLLISQLIPTGVGGSGVGGSGSSDDGGGGGGGSAIRRLGPYGATAGSAQRNGSRLACAHGALVGCQGPGRAFAEAGTLSTDDAARAFGRELRTR